jgi:hypothetical protein
VNSIELVGGDRSLDLEPGVNVVVGPIATGKSTLVKLLRALFGNVPSMPPEVEQNVSAVRASVTIGVESFNIMRRLVTTDTALVEIVSDDEALMLPASRPTATRDLTYSTWMLHRLDLPQIAVPAAPTRPESEPTSVSVADYLNYSFLRGDEIDNCVFGHTNAFRDIKRKYVFEIVYGLYDESIAELQAELRSIEAELTFLRGEQATTKRVFEGTELESIEAVRVALGEREREVARLMNEESGLADASAAELGTASLRQDVERANSELAYRRLELESAKAQLQDLDALVVQLEAQQARIVRAILAEEALVDFEFVICPRCGQELADERGNDGQCRLCLQAEPQHAHVEGLESERERLDEQLRETIELLEARRLSFTEIEDGLVAASQRRAQLAAHLEQVTAAFVSDRQQTIADAAAARATAAAEAAKFRDYLVILERAEASEARVAELNAQRVRLRERLEEASARLRAGQENVDALNDRFLDYVRRLEVPSFGEALTAHIDASTYLPVVAGRRFETLSSQGLQVLVNIAHALAHHTVAIDRGLRLPGLLVLDGPSSNVGTEGFDAQRLADVYDLLAEVGAEYSDSLQIIVVDNTIPERAEEWVRLRLEEDDRLVVGTTGAAGLDGEVALGG